MSVPISRPYRPHVRRVGDFANSLTVWGWVRDAFTSVTGFRRGQDGASLARGPITKAFICSLGYSNLNWPPNSDGEINPMQLLGSKYDLMDLLGHIEFAHGDPRFVVLTDFKWTYAGTTVEPQPTTRNDISLSHFISSLDKDDKALIYFAGHGVLLENEMPSYQALVATNPEYKHSLIDAPALKDAIFGSLRSAAALVIALDACCSGNIISLPTTDRATKKGLENTVGNEIILIAAAQRDGRAFSTRIGGSETHHLRGVMTHHLLNYLREYPIAKVERLRMHLERECTAATQKDVGGPQKPVISLSHRSIKRLTLG